MRTSWPVLVRYCVLHALWVVVGLLLGGFIATTTGCARLAETEQPPANPYNRPLTFEEVIQMDQKTFLRRQELGARHFAHFLGQEVGGSSGSTLRVDHSSAPEAYTVDGESGSAPWEYHLGYAAHRLIAEHYRAAHPRHFVIPNFASIRAIVDEAGGNVGLVNRYEADLRPDIADVTSLFVFEIKPPGPEHLAQGQSKIEQHLRALDMGMVGAPPFKLGLGYRGELGVRFESGIAAVKLEWQTTAPGVLQFRWRRLDTEDDDVDDDRKAYEKARWRDLTAEEMERYARPLHKAVEELVRAREELGQTRAAAKMPVVLDGTHEAYAWSVELWSAEDEAPWLLPVVKKPPDPRFFGQTSGAGSGGRTLLTTTELRRIYGNPKGLTGIRYNQDVGLMFQRLVLSHMPGPKINFANTKRFPSKVRDALTNSRYSSVIPDGVAGASIGSKSPLGALISTYPESTFIEVKAVKGKITRRYGQHQIDGMLDVLSRSQAARSTGEDRAFPNMYFVTTGDTIIAPDVVQEATRLNILLWLSFVTVDPSNNVQVMPPVCLNCLQVLVINVQSQGFVLPGLPFRLKSQPLPRVPVLFDAPILDDGLVGDPGVPGSTTPNP